MNPWETAGRIILQVLLAASIIALSLGVLVAFDSRRARPARVFLYCLAVVGLLALSTVMFIAIDQLEQSMRALRQAQ